MFTQYVGLYFRFSNQALMSSSWPLAACQFDDFG